MCMYFVGLYLMLHQPTCSWTLNRCSLSIQLCRGPILRKQNTTENIQLSKTFSAFQRQEKYSRVLNTRTRGWHDLCLFIRSQNGYTHDVNVFLLALPQVHHCISARQRGYFQTVDAKQAETSASITPPNCHSQEVWKQFCLDKICW